MKMRACVIGDTKHGGYGHGFDAAFTGYEDIEIVALADPDESGRTEVGERIRVKNLYSDYREMLEKEKPNLVAIGPRFPNRHKEYLLACVDVGAHGYLEKPVAVDLVEIDEMVAAVESKNLKWSVGFQLSLSPSFLHAKQQLKEGLIGELLEVRARGKEDQRAGGEDLIVLGIHLFDALISIFGPPKTCQSAIYTDGRLAKPSDVHEPTEPLGPVVGNRLIADYSFENALPVSFQSLIHPNREASRFGIDFFGSKGILKIRWGFPPTVSYQTTSSWLNLEDSRWRPLPGAPEDREGLEPNAKNRRVVTDLLAAIKEDRFPEVCLQRARWAHEMIQGAFESHTAGKTIRFPLTERTHPLRRWA